MKNTTATLFFFVDKWLSKQADCFGCCLGARALPGGVIVCGFIVGDTELFDTPDMTTDQDIEWHRLVAITRKHLREANP